MPDSIEAPLADGVWQLIPNFDLQSRYTYCSVTGQPRRETDIGIFRPRLPVGYVEYEGFYDITQVAIEAAAKLLGWRSPEHVAAETARLYERERAANVRLASATRKIKALEAQLKVYTEADLPLEESAAE